MTRYILDSGDPEEYREIVPLAAKRGEAIWGATTNPTLIAKKIGEKLSPSEAFDLQKKLVLEILTLVPGAVSAEVYADESTTPQDMFLQGRQIAAWDRRIVVKLPTTYAGFVARTLLRKEGIIVNNTLVFSQQQIFAICLHEKVCSKEYESIEGEYPSFISPFVGRLDDIGVNGMDLIEQGMRLKTLLESPLWMLEASVRTLSHMQKGLEAGTELITAPAKVYKEWFGLTDEQRKQEGGEEPATLTPIEEWHPTQEMLAIPSVDVCMHALEKKEIDIQHDLTDKGLEKFASDWKSILE